MNHPRGEAVDLAKKPCKIPIAGSGSQKVLRLLVNKDFGGV